MDSQERETACEWFALCDRDSVGLAHVVGEHWTPVCDRCAAQVGLTDEQVVRWGDPRISMSEGTRQ